MVSYVETVRFVVRVSELHNKRPRVFTNNELFQSSPPHTYCSPFLFLADNVDSEFISSDPPFESFCDWGAGIGITLLYTKRLFPRVEAFGVEKDYELIEQVKDSEHAPIHGNVFTFAKTASINYTFNISWNRTFKIKMFNRIMDLMSPGQYLIEAYDHDNLLRDMVQDSAKELSCKLINFNKDRYPYTIVRKI